jgi:transporter family-2 protein
VSRTTDPSPLPGALPGTGHHLPSPPRALLEVVAVPSMVGMGALVAVQSEINGELAQRLGGGVRAAAAAAVISFGAGLVLLALAVALLPGPRAGLGRLVRGARTRELRVPQLLGGVAGALLVASQGLTVGTIGVALFTVALVAGQTSSALLVDRLGLGPSGVRAVTAGRVVGALVTVAAVVLTVAGRLLGADGLAAAALALALVPLVAGAGTSWQQAVNGRVSGVAGPVAAAFNNFVVGSVLLVLLLGASLLVPGDLVGLPGAWWLYAGGPIGVVFIAASAALVKVHGVLVLGLCVVAGQVTTSVVLDALGGDSHLGAATVTGAAVALVGVVIGALASRRAPTSRAVPAAAPGRPAARS